MGLPESEKIDFKFKKEGFTKLLIFDLLICEAKSISLFAERTINFPENGFAKT
jgi:hypothetical protein